MLIPPILIHPFEPGPPPSAFLNKNRESPRPANFPFLFVFSLACQTISPLQ